MPTMASTLLFILYCLEAGVFFIIAPWTSFWTTNPLFQSTELLAVLTESFYLRGLISGLGLVHLLVGTREAILLFTDRRSTGVRPGERRR
jgi:hypothetical protein